MRNRPEVAVVVPFFNEEDNIERMYRALTEALDTQTIDFDRT